MKKIVSVMCMLVLVFSLSACGAEPKQVDTEEQKQNKTTENSESENKENTEKESENDAEKKEKEQEEQKESEKELDKEEKESEKDSNKEDENKGNVEDKKGEETMSNNPIVTISTKIGDKALGDMKLELYPEKAPNTVTNFITLANDGYYDGLIFHRIIKDFMIQGGDPTGTGMGGPGYTVPGEFSNNGFKENDIKHERGVISMARSQMPDSAGSQFFICHKDAFFLDGEYAAFGKLLEGEDVLDELAEVSTDGMDKPNEADCIMTKITVDLNGYELPELIKK